MYHCINTPCNHLLTWSLTSVTAAIVRQSTSLGKEVLFKPFGHLKFASFGFFMVRPLIVKLSGFKE